jgi:hypothetical protein
MTSRTGCHNRYNSRHGLSAAAFEAINTYSFVLELHRRRNSSFLTHCWREMDSNHRSPARNSRFLLRKATCGTERGQPKRVVSYAVPMVRIHLPPGESQAKSLARQRLRGGTMLHGAPTAVIGVPQRDVGVLLSDEETNVLLSVQAGHDREDFLDELRCQSQRHRARSSWAATSVRGRFVGDRQDGERDRNRDP